MFKSTTACSIAFLTMLTPGMAQTSTPLDMSQMDAKEVQTYLGTWIVKDESGKKKCTVNLTLDKVIGGMKIDVSKKCAKLFPLMGEVMAWRVYEGFEIAFADATRKELIRFYTPDNDYISYKAVDGIFGLDKK